MISSELIWFTYANIIRKKSLFLSKKADYMTEKAITTTPNR